MRRPLGWLGGGRTPSASNYNHSSRWLVRRGLVGARGRGLWSAAQTRGRERHQGMWWDRKFGRLLEEGKDFVPDTQDGPGDQFEFIPDSDDEEVDYRFSSEDNNEEFVPETELQDAGEVEKKGGGIHPSAKMRGWGRLRGKWRHRKSGHLYCEEGKDFAWDTQDRPDDEYEFIPDLDDEGDFQFSFEDGNNNFVAKTDLRCGGQVEGKGVVAGQIPAFGVEGAASAVTEASSLPTASYPQGGVLRRATMANHGTVVTQHSMAKSSNLKEQCKEVSIPFITSEEEVASDKQDGGSQFVGVDLGDCSQEEEYEPIDDFKLEMLRLLIPGYIQCFTTKNSTC
ncbi:hypothetical protein E2562_028832 [Oryza meyeriana var. granulata]|uniref:Uncharacterized protein n=1 Tax=Oryza meyeriana var. granulata TaxID=110450 RepID=A0A6G1FD44_9ORYZ|nr:hypothetical protein E2562_028832 [Oryza meyeriana var. granulata]